MGILRKDKDYLLNPYLIYEDLRRTLKPVALSSVDLGLYIKNPPDAIFPGGLLYDDPFNNFRVRALTIQQLELAALLGHTLLPRKQIIKQIRELTIQPACPINSDYFELAEDSFKGDIDLQESIYVKEKLKSVERAYQLARFGKTRTIISQKINDRINGKRLPLKADWNLLLDTALAPFTTGSPDEQEMKARKEKAVALKEIAEARFSVLIGPAGTGKTTLLTILAGQKEVEDSGVLLLAPTGKARVRMEEIARNLNVTRKDVGPIPFRLQSLQR